MKVKLNRNSSCAAAGRLLVPRYLSVNSYLGIAAWNNDGAPIYVDEITLICKDNQELQYYARLAKQEIIIPLDKESADLLGVSFPEPEIEVKTKKGSK